MDRRDLLVGTLLAAGLLAASASARSAEGDHFLWRQCNEDAMALNVDPGALQERVGPDFPVALEEGNARISILFQDCSEYWIDGRDYGPTQDLHVLVRLEGGGDVRAVVGAPETLPTMRWFQLFSGTDNNRVRRLWRDSGRSVESIEEVSVDSPGRHRSGQAVVDGHLSFAWDVTSEPSPVPVVGVNHEIFSRDDDGRILLVQVQALANVAAGFSQGTLEVAGNHGERIWIGSGKYPVSVFSPQPMRARATIGRVPAEAAGTTWP